MDVRTKVVQDGVVLLHSALHVEAVAHGVERHVGRNLDSVGTMHDNAAVERLVHAVRVGVGCIPPCPLHEVEVDRVAPLFVRLTHATQLYRR